LAVYSLFVYISSPRQQIYTNNREIVERVVFYDVCIMTKGSRRLYLPRTSFIYFCMFINVCFWSISISYQIFQFLPSCQSSKQFVGLDEHPSRTQSKRKKHSLVGLVAET
jgi:hypothetical protein